MLNQHPSRTRLLHAALLTPILAWPGMLWQLPTESVAADSPNLAAAAQEIATEAALCLKSHGGNSLVVGPFLGPPGGPGGKVLEEHVKARLPKGTSTLSGFNSLGLSGGYYFTRSKRTGKMQLTIETHVIDSLGKPLRSLTPWLLTDKASVDALVPPKP
ncbi:MAG: hypothetical protein AB7O62_10950 [Pirellulales bacterium]